MIVLYIPFPHLSYETGSIHLSLGGGVDVGADEGLAEDGDQAALGLLTLGSASVDETVDGGGGDGWRSAVKVGEVQDVGSAADWVAGAAETNLALLKRGGHGGDGKGEDGGELHFGGSGGLVG